MTWSEWVDSGAWRRADPALQMPPTIAAHVMPLVTNPDVTVLQLTRIISKDQVLATRVLRLANAAYCAPMQEVTTINDAIVRMGTAAVRNAVFAVCFAANANEDLYGERARGLTDHAVGTAYLARMVAEQAEIDLDEGFLQGLLHDIGKLLILKLGKECVRLQVPEPSSEELDAYLEKRHAALGALLMKDWGLPPALATPVRYHHDPWNAPEFPDEAAAVYVANRLSHRYGFGCHDAQRPDTAALLADEQFQRFDIGEAWIARADAYAPGLFQVARQIVS